MNDADFMTRALELAAQGVGRTGENPCVGCVLVRDGVVIGEACTADTGRPHAEEQALAATDAAGATAYVTLEPCAQRSTGAVSCADLLIAAGVARVVIAACDPHPFAAGVGVERLRAADVRVELGLMEAEARAQNADFFARWVVAKPMADIVLRLLAVLLPICGIALLAAAVARVALPTWLMAAFVSFALVSIGSLFLFFPSVVRDFNLRAAPREASARQRHIEAHSREHYATLGRAIGVACVLGGLLVLSGLAINLAR